MEKSFYKATEENPHHDKVGGCFHIHASYTSLENPYEHRTKKATLFPKSGPGMVWKAQNRFATP